MGDAMTHYRVVVLGGRDDQWLTWPRYDRAGAAEMVRRAQARPDRLPRPIGIWRVTPKIRGEFAR